MAISVVGYDGAPFAQYHVLDVTGRMFHCKCLLVFSGSYSTGGDTLDFTNGGVNSCVLAPFVKLIDVDIHAQGPAASQSAIGGYYSPVGFGQPASYPLSGKLKIFAAAGSELSAGAYPSAVTTDVVGVDAYFSRQ
jgi:hypothetical protein